MPPHAPSLIRLERSPLTQLIARVLVLTLLSWSLPFDMALPPRRSADANAAESSVQAAGDTLYVNASASSACDGRTPCFTSIQRAIDAVGPGERIEIQAGTYVEQLRIQRKNPGASAREADRIVIEADPVAPPGSVVLRGRVDRCEGGYAIDVSRSKYVTIRGLTTVGAGGRGIGLRGGSLENRGIHLERNRIGRGGPRECNGGIDVGRGNPETVIANNLIHGNARNGIRFRDGRGGSYFVVGNTIARNAWSGIQIAHAAKVELVNNVVVANGGSPGAAQSRVGVRRLRTNPSPASDVRLLGNLVCGNVGGELAGPLLDATDAGNLTPTGSEGVGVAASAGCGDLAVLFADADGADDQADTADDDFHNASGSPAIDAGVDPRALGHPAANAVYEADFDRAGARPRDGDADQGARFDAGAHETSGDQEPTPTPTNPPTTTPDPATPTPTPTPTATPSPTPTPAPTAEPTATPEPTADPTPTPEPIPCLSCDACDTGQPGICSVGRTFCDGPFAEPQCRTTIEPRTESCGNAIDEDCDGEIDEGGVPEQLPTTPPQTGVFVEPLGTTIKFFNQGSAIGLAQGDFDQDGLVDLATAEDANVHNGRRVSITFGNGDGTFSEPTYLALAPQHAVPQSVLAHDFDRDGPLDLLVAMRELHQVYFYRGDGSGGFAAPVPSSVGGLAHQIQTADLNCDGILDVATIVDATHVTVAFGNGDGTFGATTSYLFNHNLADLALTDVNGDGHPDLVTASNEFAPSGGIGVRLNDGAGQLGELVHTPGWTVPDQFGNRNHIAPFGIQVANFDGDSSPDAVVTTHACFVFFKGNGDGTFQLPDLFNGSPDLDPSWTCMGGGQLLRRYTDNVAPDLNADGKPDVLFYWDENRVAVGLGRGDGKFDASAFAASAGSGFQGSQTYQRADGSGMLAAIVADVNGDCMLDLVTNHRQTNGAHGRQGVLLARAPGDFHAPRIAPLLRDPTGDNGNQMERGVVTGDFDKDGNPDFAAGVGRAFFTVPGAGIGIDIWKGNGDGRGEALPITLNNFAGTGSAYLRTADFDQDGFLDFVFQGGDGPFGRRHSVSTVFGQGDFTFVDRQSAYSPRLDADEVHIRNIITTDLDGDEDPDVVALYDNGGFTKWFATFSNTGTRAPLQFVQEVEVGQGSNGRGIVAADFDGDDIPDLVAQDSGFANPQRIRLFKGNGDLTFAPGVSIFEWTNQGAAAAEDFVAADLDEDGDQDLVMAQYHHACAYVLLGHDDGSFDAPVCYPFWTSGTSRLAVDDFDVDGSLDIVAGVEDGGLMYLRGRGDGTFETTQMYAVGRANTQAVNVADFDRDGRPDLLWSYNDGNFGHSIVLSNATGAVPTPTPAPTATLPPGVTHTPRPTASPSPTPSPVPTPALTPPPDLVSVRVDPTSETVATGTNVQFRVIGILGDGSRADVSAAAAWGSSSPGVATIDPSGLARALTAGDSSITASVGALDASANLTVRSRAPSDTAAPIAEITAPAEDAELSLAADVIGTASDPNLLSYTLSLESDADPARLVLGGGTASITTGVLGRIDPTLLVNGIYRIVLDVVDVNGRTTTVVRPVRVVGRAKVGLFTIAYSDLLVALSGLAVEVTRTYDSRVKVQRDFGFGWSLDVRRASFQNNRKPGAGWQIADGPFGLPCVNPVETKSHSTEIRIGEREFYRFRARLVNPSLDVGGCLGRIRFDFVDGSSPGATLEILGNDGVVYLTDTDEVLDQTTFDVFDPTNVRLRTRDGRVYEFDRAAGGVTRIADANANALTFSAAGVQHSSGRSIGFVRDATGRIVQITDPMNRVYQYDYDAVGDLVRFTNPLGHATRFIYDDDHGLLEIVDPTGNRPVRVEYDADGRTIAVIGASGARTELTHDISGREEIVRDPRGNVRRMTYDEDGNVLADEATVTIDGVPVLARTTSTYDALGNEISTTDPDGAVRQTSFDHETITGWTVDPGNLALATSLTYDTAGNLLTYDAPGTPPQQFTYDGAGNVRQIVATDGAITQIDVDATGSPVRTTDATGTQTVVTRDAFGNVLREDVIAADTTLLRRREFTYDANGNALTDTLHRTIGGTLEALTTTFIYDAANQLIEVRDPHGGVVGIERDELGRETARVDQLGRRTEMTYDDVGRLTRVTYPDGAFEERSFDADGNLIEQRDRGGRTVSFEHDELGRVVRTVLADGSSERSIYSPGGLLLASIDPKGNRTDYEYDDAGRRVRTIGAAAFDVASNSTVRPETSEIRNARGLVAQLVDPLGRTTTFHDDAAGRPYRTVFADGGVVERVFDSLGRVSAVVDEDGRRTELSYDGLGRLASVTQPAPGVGEPPPVTAYEYDEAGNLIVQRDALGRETRYRYDRLGRLVERRLPGGQLETMEYDAVGRLRALTDANGDRTTLDYDAADRVTRKTRADGSTVDVSYTASGKRASLTDQGGTTQFAYDSLDRLERVTHPGGDLVEYAWDANSNLTSLTAPAVSTAYEYDALNRLVRVVSSQGDTLLSYDRASNRRRTIAPNALVTELGHDVRGRVTSVLHRTQAGIPLASFAYDLLPSGRRERVTELDGSIETYAYDGMARLIGETRTGTAPYAITHEYDAVGNRLRTVRDGVATDFTYDVNDRLIGETGASYDYDAAGNLLRRTAGASVTNFAHNLDGRLTEVASAGGTVRYGYDASGNRVSRESGGATSRFLVDSLNPSGLPQVLEERDGGGTLQASYAWGDRLVAMQRGGVDRFFHRDAHGSTRLLTDAAAAATDSYAYDAYGNVAAAGGTTDNPYLYVGERFDPAAGLYHLRARDYSPALGRFLSRDRYPGAQAEPASLHRYAYGNGDPVNNTDPTGRTSLSEVMTNLQIRLGLQTAYQELVALKKGCEGIAKGTAVAEFAFFGGLALSAALAWLNFDPKLGFTIVQSRPKSPLWNISKAELRYSITAGQEATAFNKASRAQHTFGGSLDFSSGRKAGFEINITNPFKSNVSVGRNLTLAEVKACGTVSLFKLDMTFRFKLTAEQLLRPTLAAEEAQREDPLSSFVDDALIAGLSEGAKSAIPEVGLEGNLFGVVRVGEKVFPSPFMAFVGLGMKRLGGVHPEDGS